MNIFLSSGAVANLHHILKVEKKLQLYLSVITIHYIRIEID